MTLVYRSPKLQYSQPQPTPGPTTYSQPPPKASMSLSSVFSSKIVRKLPLENHEVKVGPGSYFNKEDENSKESKSKGSVMFSSKIERFKDGSKQNCKKEEQEEDEDYKMVRMKIPGKVITSKERKQAEKELAIPQRLPSIPSQEQSFGYKFDTSTNKLVTNDNPKIIFAKKIGLKQEDFYFQRVQNTLGKNQKANFMSKVARSSPELKHLTDLPPSTKYHPEHYSAIGHNKSSTINLAVSQGRFEEQNCHKEKLLMGRLKNQFRQYIKGEVDLKALEQVKSKKTDVKTGGCSLRKSTERPQCFMAKENRFYLNQQKKKDIQTKRAVQGIGTTGSQLQNSTVRVENKSFNVSNSKKQPFGSSQGRFQEKEKQNLGPGSYDFQKPSTGGACLLQNEQRFKEDTTCATPGPGSYSTDPLSKPVRQKTQFHRYQCRSNQKGQQNRFNSMQDLYQQVGRHMNYYHKMQKERGKQSSHHSLPKDHEKKLQSLQKAKENIRNKIGLSPQQLLVKDESRLKIKSPKHMHLYDYQRPEPAEVRTGPGCYEIATTLDKKSYNISEPPSYC